MEEQLHDQPADVKAELERGYLQVFPEYLAEVHAALDRAWAEASAKPTEASFTALDENIDQARTAARGTGRGDEQTYERIAAQLTAQHVDLAPTVFAATAKLALRADEVDELRSDALGVPNGGFSVGRRVELLSPLPQPASAAQLSARLNEVEAALKASAGRLAANLLSALRDALAPSETRALMREEPLPKELAAVDQRYQALRGAVGSASIDATLGELRALRDRHLASPEIVSWHAAPLVTSEVSSPTQKKAAGELLLASQLEYVAGWQHKLDAVTELLKGATGLGPELRPAVESYKELQRTVSGRAELTLVGGDARAQVDAAAQTYATGLGRLAAQVETLARATLRELRVEVAKLDQLPVAEQEAAAKTVSGGAACLEQLRYTLRTELGDQIDALTSALYDRAYPAGAVRG